MKDHGDKGKRDKKAGRQAPPCFTPLWGSPPGGPRTPESPQGGTVEQPPIPSVIVPLAPPVPLAPQGSFFLPIQLRPQDNYIDVQASQGARSGSATRTCFYSCDPGTYKAACMPLDYASTVNSVDAHKFERVSFKGRVDSRKPDGGGSTIVYMDTSFRDGEWTDRVAVISDSALTVLSGDIIQVWGELTSQLTVLDVRMPEIKAAYIEPAAQ